MAAVRRPPFAVRRPAGAWPRPGRGLTAARSGGVVVHFVGSVVAMLGKRGCCRIVRVWWLRLGHVAGSRCVIVYGLGICFVFPEGRPCWKSVDVVNLCRPRCRLVHVL